MSAKVTIIGNLGRNPETRINANNTFIANFSIAVNHQRKSNGGEVKQTDWYNITATGKQAQVLAEYAHKGDPLLVEGKQTVNPWIDREGNARVSVDVLVSDFVSWEWETAPPNLKLRRKLCLRQAQFPKTSAKNLRQ